MRVVGMEGRPRGGNGLWGDRQAQALAQGPLGTDKKCRMYSKSDGQPLEIFKHSDMALLLFENDTSVMLRERKEVREAGER